MKLQKFVVLLLITSVTILFVLAPAFCDNKTKQKTKKSARSKTMNPERKMRPTKASGATKDSVIEVSVKRTKKVGKNSKTNAKKNQQPAAKQVLIQSTLPVVGDILETLNDTYTNFLHLVKMEKGRIVIPWKAIGSKLIYNHGFFLLMSVMYLGIVIPFLIPKLLGVAAPPQWIDKNSVSTLVLSFFIYAYGTAENQLVYGFLSRVVICFIFYDLVISPARGVVAASTEYNASLLVDCAKAVASGINANHLRHLPLCFAILMGRVRSLTNIANWIIVIVLVVISGLIWKQVVSSV